MVHKSNISISGIRERNCSGPVKGVSYESNSCDFDAKSWGGDHLIFTIRIGNKATSGLVRDEHLL